MENQIKINDVIEHFTSIQGEGPRQGRRALFIRFKKCNLNCSFCDTMVRIKNLQSYSLSSSTIKNMISKEIVDYVVITGGEPGLYYDTEVPKIFSTIQQIYKETKKQITIGIETNGYNIKDIIYLYVNTYSEYFNLEVYCSPKYKTLDQFSNFFKKNIESFFYDMVYFKIIISSDIPYDDILKFLIENEYPRSNIYVQPEGRSSTQILYNMPTIADLFYKYNINISCRLHILGLIP